MRKTRLTLISLLFFGLHSACAQTPPSPPPHDFPKPIPEEGKKAKKKSSAVPSETPERSGIKPPLPVMPPTPVPTLPDEPEL